jgi:hypothetical protein
MRPLFVPVCLAVIACGKVETTGPDAGANSPPPSIAFHNLIGNGQTANAGLVAYQDGDGPWQVVTGTGGNYTFTVTSGRYGLAVVCDRTAPAPGQGIPVSELAISYYAPSDAAELALFADCVAIAPTAGPTPPAAVNVGGQLAGAQLGDTIDIATGGNAFDETDNGAAPITSWSATAEPGPGFLLARRLVQNRPVGLVFSPETYAAGTPININFAQAVLPTEVGLTLDPTATAPSIETDYIAPSGLTLAVDAPPSTATTYRVLPPDKIGDGLSRIIERANTNNTASRLVEHVFKAATAQTLTLPQTFLPKSPPAMTATTPYPSYAVTLPKTTDPLYYRVDYSGTMPGQPTGLSFWALTYSAAWLTAAGKADADLDVELPDLSKLAGWKPSFALPTSQVQWNVQVDTGPVRRLPYAVVPAAQGPIRQDGDVATDSESNGTLP